MKYNSYDILFVLGSLSIGGVEKINISIANHLSSNYQKKICIVVLTNKNPLLKSLISKKVDLIIFNNSRVYQSCIEFLFLIRKLKPKIIFSSLNYINIFSFILMKISFIKSKIILSERIDIGKEVTINKSFKQKIYQFFFKLLILRIYNYADLIHCISNGVKYSLHETYGIEKKNMKVIYNPIDLSVVDKKKVVNKIYKANGILNILSVGRLEKQKDYNTLIKSLVFLKDKIRFHLYIVGKGSEFHNLINLSKKLELSKNITFVGELIDPWSYYEAADIFILSSIYEGFGNVIVEALAFNCNVISSDCHSGPRNFRKWKMGKALPCR